MKKIIRLAYNSRGDWDIFYRGDNGNLGEMIGVDFEVALQALRQNHFRYRLNEFSVLGDFKNNPHAIADVHELVSWINGAFLVKSADQIDVVVTAA